MMMATEILCVKVEYTPKWNILNAIQSHSHSKKLASLEATLVRNYDPPTDRLDGEKCRAFSVGKKMNCKEKALERERTSEKRCGGGSLLDQHWKIDRIYD